MGGSSRSGGGFGPAVNNILFVQEQQNITAINSNNVSTGAFLSAVTSAHFMICFINYNSGVQSISNLTDTSGNLYVSAVGPLDGAGVNLNWRIETWYSSNIIGGAGLNVTAHFTGTFNAEKDIYCHEYSGVVLAGPVDQAVQTNGVTANAVSPALNTTAPAELIFSGANFAGVGSTGVGFTGRSPVTEDTKVTSSGSYTSNFTNGAQDWMVQAVTLISQ